MSEVLSLWQIHRDSDWPRFSDPNEGALMTLDTVISGCVTYYLESTEGLDPQRVEILKSCLEDLNGLLPTLPEEAGAYFERLRTLGLHLLAAHPL
ncbi:MAG: hypothetical protein FJ246_00115 [Nitrospira sp.]|nr:hypothetical protein [Nitrospira sp.]